MSEEYETIALKKIWKTLGIEDYEQAKGKSVDEWVADLKQQRDDLLAACKVGASYIHAIVCKVPRPIMELKEDKELVEAAIAKAKPS